MGKLSAGSEPSTLNPNLLQEQDACTPPPRWPRSASLPFKGLVDSVKPRESRSRMSRRTLPGCLALVSGASYDLSFRALVPPPRAEYGMEELDPSSFHAQSMSCVREDLELQGGRGTLQCSHFRPYRPEVAALERDT